VPTRDPGAVAALQNSLAAMGGLRAIAAVQNSVTLGTRQAAEGNTLPSGDFTWETSGDQFRYDEPAKSGRAVFVSNGQSPQQEVDGKVSRVPRHIAEALFPFQLPAVTLLRELQNPSYSITFKGNKMLNGAAVVHIRTVLMTDAVTIAVTPQDWYFDAQSFLPVQVAHLLPYANDALKSVRAEDHFSEYRSVSEVQIPFQIGQYQSRQLRCTYELKSVEFNTKVSASDFTVAGGGR
jgi:outer membrane lipoprotein-sorting protein